MTDKSATLPSLLHGMFHAVETSELFACERKVFEYEYLTIILRGRAGYRMIASPSRIIVLLKT